MADTIHDLLPPSDQLENFHPSDLAALILPELLSRYKQNPLQHLSIHNLTLFDDRRSPQAVAMAEALGWLIQEGLLIPAPGAQAGSYIPSRRAREMQTPTEFNSYRHAALLPKALLHSGIAQSSYADFARGDYGGAVFKAFREVEVAVRHAGNYAETDIGVPLVRKAFDAKTGLLADPKQNDPEREALPHLFAGAIGSYKNPASHRKISLDAEQAVEMLMLASHLLKIVDSRKAKTSA